MQLACGLVLMLVAACSGSSDSSVPSLPGLFVQAKAGSPVVSNSTIQ